MILLGIDTCDSRGSIAVLRDGSYLRVVFHDTAEDYSSWLLPAVAGALKAERLALSEVDAYAACSGPGSFTGVRIGLTTVKAWSEVYTKPIAAVSRLEAVGVYAAGDSKYVAAFVDAHRGQIFGALYERQEQGLRRVKDELVSSAADFLEWVAEASRGERVAWVSPDPEHVTLHAGWRERVASGESMQTVSAVFAPAIGRLGWRKILQKRATDVLALDADYVRRSDAELFWKGETKSAGRAPK